MLSLIIPTYNCIEYLDETLGSVVPQLPDDYELVIVDDGSGDGTAEKLAEFRKTITEKGKDNIKIILNEHKGVSGARNAGIKAASKRFISFMDCDDCLIDGFFEKCREVLKTAADLYVFSFETVQLTHSMNKECVTPSEVSDKIYENNSDFADDYIRTRHLLVYSACNKFYRKDLLEEHGIRFKEGLDFGEDRLFNYDYIPFAGRIITSRVRMFRYMQRNPDSASHSSFPGYYNTIMMLHRAKMDCFLELSKGTSDAEKEDFVRYDYSNEMRRMAEKDD